MKTTILSIAPELYSTKIAISENEKIIYLKVNSENLERYKGRKKNMPYWQMSIAGTVKG